MENVVTYYHLNYIKHLKITFLSEGSNEGVQKDLLHQRIFPGPLRKVLKVCHLDSQYQRMSCPALALSSQDSLVRILIWEPRFTD
jgi:hypothetical protein